VSARDGCFFCLVRRALGGVRLGAVVALALGAAFLFGGAVCARVALVSMRATETMLTLSSLTNHPRRDRVADRQAAARIATRATIEVSREVVDDVLEEQATATPSKGFATPEDRPEWRGVVVSWLKPDGWMRLLGFQVGDIVESINGYEVSTPEKALEAYARLRTSDEIEVVLVRKGKIRVLDYRIR